MSIAFFSARSRADAAIVTGSVNSHRLIKTFAIKAAEIQLKTQSSHHPKLEIELTAFEYRPSGSLLQSPVAQDAFIN